MSRMLRFPTEEALRAALRAPKAKAPDAKAAFHALGRLPAGAMNKTEAKFHQYLVEQQLAGRILWHRFEGITLRLAKRTSITIDFAVLQSSGLLQMIDVKGSPAIFTDDARAKMKIAAATFPFEFMVAYPRAQKDGGGWHIEMVEG